jgi:hypothetical protein
MMWLDRRGTFSTRRVTYCLVVLGLLAYGSSVCQATLLNLDPHLIHGTDITSSFAVASYNTASKLLSISGTASVIDYDQTAPLDANVSPGGAGKPASFLINVHVDSLGALLAPATATDLKIMGLIAGGPHPSPVYGTLLTGQVTKFGYANNSPNRLFEFVFLVTGGSQMAYFGTTVGIIFDSITGFHGSFATNFTTSINGNSDTFAVPEPSALMLVLVAGLVAAASVGARRARGRFVNG